MSKKVNEKWKKTFPAAIGNQTRPANGVDDTQPFETGGFPQYIANDPVLYDLQNAAMSQSMSNDARLKEMVDARGKELDDHKVDPGAHKTGIAGNAATATKVVTTAASGASANIAEATMASNDLARIRVSGETNAGELALETADDGSEPIVARQYTGIYTTPVRTAKILDESGNTSFPGTVVAPKFTGSLNGNAATATKLQTPRTLSLTGNASGSTTFDGSGNASINTTVNAINNQGVKTAIKDGTKEPSGLKLYEVYINGEYPTAYGNLISIGGNGGGELLAGWSSTDHGVEHLYYRNRREHGALWSNWMTIAFTTDINNFAPTKTGVGASGTWGISISGNANTASKLSTARKINITGNATGSASFDGMSDISINITVNESGHAADVTDATISPEKSKYNGNATVLAAGVIDSIKSKTGSSDLTNMSQFRSFIGSVYDGEKNWYDMLSLRHRNGASDGTNFGLLMYSKLSDANDTIHYKKQANDWTGERTLLDSSNYNDYAPTKTGGGASGTWSINISGNANTASSVAWSGVTGKPGTYPPSAHNHDSAYPSVTGTRASGTWGISISGNAASATNADKVDGYHASDLLRILGGNRTPVITDIFDRAGTIDMSTMSAADKAKHKANINKASNVTQDIWNNSTGIHAYGGDLDMNGYSRGALKLTQSYKNFDKIFVVGSNDDGNRVAYKLWNVYELAYAFSHSFRFQFIFEDDVYWNLYGSVRTGTDTDYVLSTDTILNCHDQNCGIIAIYGIKY